MEQDPYQKDSNKNRTRRECFAVQIRKHQRNSLFEHRRKQFFSTGLSLSETTQRIQLSREAIMHLSSQQQFKNAFIPQPISEEDARKKQKLFYSLLCQHYDYLTIFPYIQDSLFKVLEIQAQKEILQAHIHYWMELGNLLVQSRSFKQTGIELISNYSSAKGPQSPKEYILFFKHYSQIVRFFFIFFKKYPNRYLTKMPKLNQYMLETLELLTEDFRENLKFSYHADQHHSNQIFIDILSFKEKVLGWIQSKSNLVLIMNCLPENQFVRVEQNPNVYKIILECIQSKSREEQITATSILLRFLKHGDYDDLDKLYKQFGEIMTALLNQGQILLQILYSDAQNGPSTLIEKAFNQGNPFRSHDQKPQKVGQSKQIISLKNICMAILLIMDTYDSIIIDYSRGGVTLFGAQLVTLSSKKLYRRRYDPVHCQNNILYGLQMIRFSALPPQITQIRFLLSDKSINETGFWKLFGQTSFLLAHSNSVIRKDFAHIIFQLVSNGGYEESIHLCEKMQLTSLQNNEQHQVFYSEQECRKMNNEILSYLRNEKENHDIMEVFHAILSRQGEQWKTLLCVLESISSLIYYAEQEPLEPLFQRTTLQPENVPYQNSVVFRLHAQGTLNLIQGLLSHNQLKQNKSITNTAHKIIDGVAQMRNR